MAFKVWGAGKDTREAQEVPRVPKASPSPTPTVGEHLQNVVSGSTSATPPG